MAKERIDQIAQRELERWRGLTESTGVGGALIRAYWRAVGQPFPGVGVPWSAAFIVFLDESLPRTGYHMGYLQQVTLGHAREWRRLKVGEILQVGDIVVKRRSPLKVDPTEAQIRLGTALPTHGDVVIEAHRDGVVTVGGNISNTVKREFVSQPLLGNPWFAGIRKLSQDASPQLSGF